MLTLLGSELHSSMIDLHYSMLIPLSGPTQLQNKMAHSPSRQQASVNYLII